VNWAIAAANAGFWGQSPLSIEKEYYVLTAEFLFQEWAEVDDCSIMKALEGADDLGFVDRHIVGFCVPT